jgi:type I restriction enzyme M protein
MKTNPLKRGDLDDFVSCYNAENGHERKETGSFKPFAYERHRAKSRTAEGRHFDYVAGKTSAIEAPV